MAFFYGLLCFPPDPERIPHCVYEAREDAELSASYETEDDGRYKVGQRSTMGVWNLDTMDLVSLVHMGLIYRAGETP